MFVHHECINLNQVTNIKLRFAYLSLTLTQKNQLIVVFSVSTVNFLLLGEPCVIYLLHDDSVGTYYHGTDNQNYIWAILQPFDQGIVDM